MKLTIDETMELLLSEQSEAIIEVMAEIAKSSKLADMFLNSIGLANLKLLSKENILNIKLTLAVAILVGRHQATAELVSEETI